MPATLQGKPITPTSGLGLMRLRMPGALIPDSISFPLLYHAVELGITVWNGGTFYGTPTDNSLHLLHRYFTAYPLDAPKVTICIKSCITSFSPFNLDCSPSNLRACVTNANEILAGVKTLDIFGPARIDSKTPVEVTVQALKEMVDEGLIGGIQLSEVSAETIRRASRVAKIDVVEAEVSLWSRDVFENGVGEVCKELGICLLGHTPLGAGFLTGKLKVVGDMEGDHHAVFPRFLEGNFERNLELVKAVEVVAGRKGVTTAQVALAWVREMGRKTGVVLVPIPGARAEERLVENGTDVRLSEGEMEEIEGILKKFPVVGDRWPEAVAAYNEY